LASPIIKEKLGEVVAKWVNCKALGIDGVVLEFYKELWDEVINIDQSTFLHLSHILNGIILVDGTLE